MAEPTPKKRQVKNPETFRERAAKAAEVADQPIRPSRLKAGSTGFGRAVRPIGQPLKRAGQTKPLRIVGKVILPAYVRNSWRELRLVTWPSWHESRRLTYAVLIFAVIFGATIAIVDYGLDKLFRSILLK